MASLRQEMRHEVRLAPSSRGNKPAHPHLPINAAQVDEKRQGWFWQKTTPPSGLPKFIHPSQSYPCVWFGLLLHCKPILGLQIFSVLNKVSVGRKSTLPYAWCPRPIHKRRKLTISEASGPCMSSHESSRSTNRSRTTTTRRSQAP